MSEWTKSSGLDSLGDDVGCDVASCLPYWPVTMLAELMVQEGEFGDVTDSR